MIDESAFPHPGGASDFTVQKSHMGMSLRDYFAAQALNGILSGPASRDGVPLTEWFDAPEIAYKLADKMLAVRSVSSPDRANRFCKNAACHWPDCVVEGGVCGSIPESSTDREESK